MRWDESNNLTLTNQFECLVSAYGARVTKSEPGLKLTAKINDHIHTDSLAAVKNLSQMQPDDQDQAIEKRQAAPAEFSLGAEQIDLVIEGLRKALMPIREDITNSALVADMCSLVLAQIVLNRPIAK